MAGRVDLEKVAKGLRAKHRGRVSAKGGYFGAMGLAAEVEARFRVPARGGRATDPAWTERRLVPLTAETLEKLEEAARRLREKEHLAVEPMQLAALLLERSTAALTEEDAESLVGDGT